MVIFHSYVVYQRVTSDVSNGFWRLPLKFSAEIPHRWWWLPHDQHGHAGHQPTWGRPPDLLGCYRHQAMKCSVAMWLEKWMWSGAMWRNGGWFTVLSWQQSFKGECRCYAQVIAQCPRIFRLGSSFPPCSHSFPLHLWPQKFKSKLNFLGQ